MMAEEVEKCEELTRGDDRAQVPLKDGTVYSPRKAHCRLHARTLEDYVPLIGEDETRSLENVAADLLGLKILEINSTAVGGGVAEMLQSSVPFVNTLGLEAEWKVMKGSESYFEVTKSIHNLLQGKGGDFTAEMEEIYFATLRENVAHNIIDWEPDVVMIHDPQPFGLAPYLKRQGETWFWRCHIDIEDNLTEGSPLWEFMNQWVRYYDALVFSAAHYVVSHWPACSFIIPPFIDPLADKNRDMEPDEVQAVLDRYEIDPRLPIISQIGRFDPWKGIDRTIDTYRLVKEKERCQLVLAGGAATDDPEGERVLSQVYERTRDDPDIHVLNLPPRSDIEVNALQRASKVVMQPSIREGFGLTVTEAMYKARPVMSCPVGGIPMQIREGDNGYYCINLEEDALRILMLLRDPAEAESVGARARSYVEEHFLMPCRVADYLRAIGDTRLCKRYPETIISYHPWYKMSRMPGLWNG